MLDMYCLPGLLQEFCLSETSRQRLAPKEARLWLIKGMETCFKNQENFSRHRKVLILTLI